jgi:hypothetical protein
MKTENLKLNPNLIGQVTEVEVVVVIADEVDDVAVLTRGDIDQVSP